MNLCTAESPSGARCVKSSVTKHQWHRDDDGNTWQAREVDDEAAQALQVIITSLGNLEKRLQILGVNDGIVSSERRRIEENAQRLMKALRGR